ncbi:MAG: hypothetical protein PHU12_00425 [Candidatus Aenigmarchaeota archaeon]|nr:hypothetical protein [Candidatus Aenigmarchaeota archaeon]
MSSKFSIKSDVLSPTASKTIEYTGNHPAQIFKMIPELIQDIFGIGTSKIWEDEIRWDTTGDPVSFYGKWRAKDSKDKFSTYWVEIEVTGQQNRERKGNVKVKIKGNVTTELSYDIAFMKLLFEMYRYSFYEKQRKTYIDEVARGLNNFEDAIRVHFDMLRRI